MRIALRVTQCPKTLRLAKCKLMARLLLLAKAHLVCLVGALNAVALRLRSHTLPLETNALLTLSCSSLNSLTLAIGLNARGMDALCLLTRNISARRFLACLFSSVRLTVGKTLSLELSSNKLCRVVFKHRARRVRHFAQHSLRLHVRERTTHAARPTTALGDDATSTTSSANASDRRLVPIQARRRQTRRVKIAGTAG